MSIMAAELTRLSSLVAEQSFEVDYQEIPEIAQHIRNCAKLLITADEIIEAIRRGIARCATRMER